jgi:hypothetical protein
MGYGVSFRIRVAINVCVLTALGYVVLCDNAANLRLLFISVLFLIMVHE